MKPSSIDGQRLFDYIEKRFDELEKQVKELQKEEKPKKTTKK